jgi:Family of unknown function (DUF5330)
MRLIRTLLLIAGIGVLLPSPPETVVAQGQAGPEVSTFAMITSASSAFADVASFCQRQPDVCQTATYVAGRLEAKAKYSARLIYEWASDATTDPAALPGTQEAIKVDMMETGSVKVAANDPPPAKEEDSGQSTLQIEDLIPEWRGPVPPKQKEG